MPTAAVVDLGNRGGGDDVARVQVIYRGNTKSLTAQRKAWLCRRKVLKPVIGFDKADHRKDRVSGVVRVGTCLA
jgi:hypothetical protein